MNPDPKYIGKVLLVVHLMAAGLILTLVGLGYHRHDPLLMIIGLAFACVGMFLGIAAADLKLVAERGQIEVAELRGELHRLKAGNQDGFGNNPMLLFTGSPGQPRKNYRS